MSRGEYRVGITFNPALKGGDTVGGEKVQEIKRAAADLIDMVDATFEGDLTSVQSDEIRRCKALAMTKIEEAAMWAVKAATKPLP